MSDLFDTDEPLVGIYQQSFESWARAAVREGLRRDRSIDMYRHMWSALSAWAVGAGLRLADVTASDLDDYLSSRGGADDLSPRYCWRLVWLFQGVVEAAASLGPGDPARSAAAKLLEARPDLRYANSAAADPLPEHLSVDEAKRLVTYLAAVRSGRSQAGQTWQQVRDRASVALMLGAGLTPGEVRALQTKDVVVEGGRQAYVPWKLRVRGNDRTAARETPVSSWGGQLLRYWLQVRGEQHIPGTHLFPSTRSTGKPWGKVSHYSATQDVLRAAGIDDPAGGSFRLRHTFAIRQLRRRTPEEDVARWMGLVEPRAIQRYRRILASPADVV